MRKIIQNCATSWCPISGIKTASKFIIQLGTSSLWGSHNKLLYSFDQWPTESFEPKLQMWLYTFDFMWILWHNCCRTSCLKLIIRGFRRRSSGGEGSINTSSSKRNDYQYCKVGRQTERFSIKIYPEARIFCSSNRSNILFRLEYFTNFGMLTRRYSQSTMVPANRLAKLYSGIPNYAESDEHAHEHTS